MYMQIRVDGNCLIGPNMAREWVFLSCWSNALVFGICMFVCHSMRFVQRSVFSALFLRLPPPRPSQSRALKHGKVGDDEQKQFLNYLVHVHTESKHSSGSSWALLFRTPEQWSSWRPFPRSVIAVIPNLVLLSSNGALRTAMVFSWNIWSSECMIQLGLFHS